VTRHAALIQHAVGIKAKQWPMNSLSPVNITGDSVIRRTLNIKQQDIPAETSPLPCGVFPKYRTPHRKRYFGKTVSTVACCGFNMHPCRLQPASPAPTPDRETGATAQVFKPVLSIHLR